MAADNTLLNLGVGGDTIRDLARGGGNTKTQVVQLDLGGIASNGEVLITAGQQLMAASIPVVLASNQPALNFTAAPSNNLWAQSLAVTAAATATVVNIASATAGYRVAGIVANGTGDGYFFIQINSVTIISGRTRSTMPTLLMMLPNSIVIAAGSNVTLKVTNESGSTADYEATLLGA